MKENPKYKIDYEIIGKKIRKKRNEYNMSQTDLADEINLTPKYVSSIERNDNATIGLQSLFAISNLFKTNVNYFLTANSNDNEKYEYEEIKNIIYRMTPEQRIFTMDIVRFILINKK